MCLNGTGTATKESVINRRMVSMFVFGCLIWKSNLKGTVKKIWHKAMDTSSLNSGMNLHSSQQLLPHYLEQHQSSYSHIMTRLTKLSSLSSDSQPEPFFSKLRGDPQPMQYRGLGDNQSWGRTGTPSPLSKARSYQLSSAIFTLMVAMITFRI